LDEPTSGLDPNQLEEIRNLIKKAGREKTVMLSTHIMQEVEAVCDRVIIINKGKIVANDDTQHLQESSQQKVVLRVEFDRETTKNSIKNIEGVIEVKLLEGNIWLIVTEADKDVRKDIFNYAVAQKLSVLAMQKEEQKLEDIFKQLTK
jgi:ABC-2 type transport system ATP-binding protein